MEINPQALQEFLYGLAKKECSLVVHFNLLKELVEILMDVVEVMYEVPYSTVLCS